MLSIVVVHCGQVVLYKDPYVGQSKVSCFTIGRTIYLFNMKFVQQYTAKTLVKKTQKTMEENTTSYQVVHKMGVCVSGKS